MEDRASGGETFRVLFVCTGNTCRSPMAEVIARRLVSGHDWSHVEVASAGVAAAPGSPASEGALRVAERHGLDLSGHAATALDESVAASADLILTMSMSHLLRVVELGAGDRAAVLTSFADADSALGGPASVPDPIGGPDELYEETFALLEELVGKALERLEPMLAP